MDVHCDGGGYMKLKADAFLGGINHILAVEITTGQKIEFSYYFTAEHGQYVYTSRYGTEKIVRSLAEAIRLWNQEVI